MDKIKYLKEKKENVIIREKKTFQIKPNNNSADYILPSIRKGCEAACLYCYSARHSPFGNPLEYYTNEDEIINKCIEEVKLLSPKKVPNQQGKINVLELGENTDLLSPKNIVLTNKLISRFQNETEIMTTFATKFSHPNNLKHLIASKPGRGRIRISLMPQIISDLLEPGTSKICDRIHGANIIYALGYELHINFAPIVLHKNWQNNYIKLFKLVDSILLPEVKEQLKCEVIFLTHSPLLHDKNILWAEEEEKLLWTPEIQEYKINNRGSKDILRYKLIIKNKLIKQFKEILKEYLPYSSIRYCF